MTRSSILAVAAVAGLAVSASAQNLIERWTFDADFSSSGNNATASTPIGDGVSITAAPGEFKVGAGALRIDHSTPDADYVDVPTPVFPEYSTNADQPVAWTVTLWYKFDPTLGPDDTRNFLFEAAPSYAAGAGLRTSDGADDMEWFLNDVAQNTSGPVSSPDEWIHFALAYDKAGTEIVAFYLNGEVQDVAPIGLGAFFAGNPFGTTNGFQDDGLHIGNHRAGDGGRNWQGFIDDFAIFDGALGPAQIRALADQTEDVTTVVANVPNDIDTLVPVFDPVAVEPDWAIAATTRFRGPAGLDLDEPSDTLFVGRRFQGDERADDPANPTETGLDGLYSIASDGTITQLAGGDNVAGVTIGPDGDIYFAEDFDGASGDGEVLRYSLATDTAITSATGFASGDSDPMNIAFVPDGFDGSAFGLDSLGDPFIEPGDAIAVDRGNGGFEEVYIWNPDTNPDAPFVGDDGFGGPNFDEILVVDGVADDGDGIGFDPSTGNAPFDNTSDVAISPDTIYIADEGQDVGGAIWELVGIDSLVKLSISEPFNPIALEYDPSTGTLLALDRGFPEGNTRVVRIDPANGTVSDVITNLGGFPGGGGNAGWGSLAISGDGTRLFVGDEISQLGRIYEFVKGGVADCPADLTGGPDGGPDGVVDANDFFAYLGLFADGDAAADLTGAPDGGPDGVIDANDFFEYLSLFSAGCP